MIFTTSMPWFQPHLLGITPGQRPLLHSLAWTTIQIHLSFVSRGMQVHVADAEFVMPVKSVMATTTLHPTPHSPLRRRIVPVAHTTSWQAPTTLRLSLPIL